MRLYTFCNYYLSSLQQGLQTAHVVHELFNKYPDNDCLRGDTGSQLRDWSLDHKTIVILNGGNCLTLTELDLFLRNTDNKFPFESFCEDGQSLNFALTCVGIVLPARIYEAAEKIRSRQCIFIEKNEQGFGLRYNLRYISNHPDYNSTETDLVLFSPFEKELIERLNQCGLAK